MKKSFIAMAISVIVSAAAVGCTSAEVQEPGAINIETTQETTEEVTQEISEDQASEETSEEASEEASAETATSEDSAADESSEDATEGASKDSKSEASDSEYDSEIDKLLASKAITPDNKDIISSIANDVLLSDLLSEKGFVFSDMDKDTDAKIQRELIETLAYGKEGIAGSVEKKDDGSKQYMSEDDLKKALKDIYGAGEIISGYEVKVDNGKVYYDFGDGEPWKAVDHPQFFEDDKYILFTGPSIYGDNSSVEFYVGHADILFKKNSDSKYGVTLVYGRYRKDNIKISSVETSSELAASKGKTYSGKNLIDGDFKTVWCEGVKGEGVGETITLKLEKKQLVSGIQICNGYTASYDLYTSNGVLTDVKVDFGNGKTVDHEIGGYAYEGFTADVIAENNYNVIELDEPVETDTITIKITGAKKGAKYDDTCVSEIMVY